MLIKFYNFKSLWTDALQNVRNSSFMEVPWIGYAQQFELASSIFFPKAQFHFLQWFNVNHKAYKQWN